MNSLAKALNAVVAERIRQEKLWGEQTLPLPAWLAILAEEFGEVAKEVNNYHGDYSRIREELSHVAAVAVQWIEAIDRKEDE